MLIDVLTRFAADSGLQLEQKRTILLRIANQAAQEMHRELECNKIYREVTLVVPPDKVVSLPSFVGELRGMRMHTNELPFDLHALSQPRYVNTTLQHKWKNWRDLGESAVHTLPTGIGQLFFTGNISAEPVEILVSGQAPTALRFEETIVMSSSPSQTVTLFGPQIYSISCKNQRRYDITISDSSGNEIAVLYSSDPKTRYKLVDVSQVFWTLDTNDGMSLIDVLYKLPAWNLFYDSDSFYAGDDYDDAWYNMCMFMFLKPMQNRLQDALAHRAVCMDFITSAKESGESGIMKKLVFGRNKFYGLFRRYRYYPGSVTSVDHNIQS